MNYSVEENRSIFMNRIVLFAASGRELTPIKVKFVGPVHI